MNNNHLLLLALLGLTACGGGGGTAGTCAGTAEICAPSVTTAPPVALGTGDSSTAAQYAGAWDVTFSGSDFGTCSAVAVDATGAMSGKCSSSTLTSFNIAGTISATGDVSFVTGNGAATFTGKATSTTAADGTWSQPVNNASGIWNAVRK